jgi:hypothetical protein
MLTPDELADFCAYWLSPTKSGRPLYRAEKTWDMKRRQRTALDRVYSQRRLDKGPF